MFQQNDNRFIVAPILPFVYNSGHQGMTVWKMFKSGIYLIKANTKAAATKAAGFSRVSHH